MNTSHRGERVRRGRPPYPLAVEYISAGGERRVERPTSALGNDFAAAPPVRRIPQYVNSSNTPGLYWASTTGAHLPYESWLEARWLLLLDYDPGVVEIVTQPMTVHGVLDGKALRHTADVFVRLDDNGGALIDVHHPRLREDPNAVAHASLTALAAEKLGWRYYQVTTPPKALVRTAAWLSGYRRLQPDAQLVDALLRVAQDSIELGALWDQVVPEVLARPASFYLLWTHQLQFVAGADRLSEHTTVSAMSGRPAIVVPPMAGNYGRRPVPAPQYALKTAATGARVDVANKVEDQSGGPLLPVAAAGQPAVSNAHPNLLPLTGGSGDVVSH